MLSLWRKRTDDSGFCRCGLYTYETWLIAERQNLKLYLAFCPVRRVDAVVLEEAGRLFKRKPIFCLKENTSEFPGVERCTLGRLDAEHEASEFGLWRSLKGIPLPTFRPIPHRRKLIDTAFFWLTGSF